MPRGARGYRPVEAMEVDSETIELTFDASQNELLKYAFAEEYLFKQEKDLGDIELPEMEQPSSWCCSPPALSEELDTCRLAAVRLAKIKMDHSNEVHGAIAATVLKMLLASPEDDVVEGTGEHWMMVGFQGSDPATDLRAAGMLALLQLLWFTENFGVEARDTLALSNDKTHGFPFATVSINLTAIGLQVIRSVRTNRLLRRQCQEPEQCTDVLNQVYVGLQRQFYTWWSMEGRMITDFQAVSERLTARALQAPADMFALGNLKATESDGADGVALASGEANPVAIEESEK
jgi:hypothetical protein